MTWYSNMTSAMASSYRFRPVDPNVFEFHKPPEAPVFEPTSAEFENPLRYIERIKPVAEMYGICKIKPPQEWQPPFAVDIKNFRFTPRVQRINELEARTRIKLNFTDRILKFWSLQGTTLKLPIIAGKLLDLYLLYNFVERDGGFYTICEENKWVKITTKLGLSPKYHEEIKDHYERILFPYSLFSQKTTPDMNPKDFTVVDPKEEDIILRYAGEEVKKNIEDARRLSEDNEVGATKSKRKKKFGTVDINCDLKKSNIETVQIKLEKDCDIPGVELDPLEKYFCMNCEGGDEEESMLLCDGCDDSYHTFCLVPPLLEVPQGDWRCPICVAKDLCTPPEAYGFDQAPRSYTLEEFGIMADKFKVEYFKSEDVSLDEVESVYWNILSRVDSNVTVQYGADLHTVEHGSGFPSKQTIGLTKDPEAPVYLKSPWNLNNLPVLPSSVLGFIKADISGMKIPWMYVGMCFATFCWHNEDHWSYSINYLHWGEPKTWYGVPGKFAEKFELVIKAAAPELFDDHPNLLHQLTTILNPNVLMNEVIPVFRTDQQAGEFVITFPRAYHAGFNQGYNFAEAVNFAPLDWVPIGRECVNYYSLMKRENVFSHDELICEIASQVENITPLMALVIFDEIMIMINTEKQFRQDLLNWGVKMSEEFYFENYPDDVRQCEVCKTTCYISCVCCRCKSSRQKIACYRHYREVCQCPPSNHILRYRWKLNHLITIANKLKAKSMSIDSWTSEARDDFNATTAAPRSTNGHHRRGLIIRFFSQQGK